MPKRGGHAGRRRYGWRPSGLDPTTGIATDVALLRLTRRFPPASRAPSSSRPRQQAATVSVVSYGMGREAVLSRQPSCNVLGRDAQIIAFDCDVTFGSSGAPVFQSDGMTTRIVSIISAGHNENGERFAFGPILEDRVAALSAALRAGDGLWASATAEPRRLRTGTERGPGARASSSLDEAGARADPVRGMSHAHDPRLSRRHAPRGCAAPRRRPRTDRGPSAPHGGRRRGAEGRRRCLHRIPHRARPCPDGGALRRGARPRLGPRAPPFPHGRLSRTHAGRASGGPHRAPSALSDRRREGGRGTPHRLRPRSPSPRCTGLRYHGHSPRAQPRSRRGTSAS